MKVDLFAGQQYQADGTADEERGERFAQLMKELADEQTALARSGQRGPDEKESDVEEGEI